MRNTGQYFEKLTPKSREVLSDNIKRLKEINDKITRFFEAGTDTAGWHRAELSKERRELKKENNLIRKGLKIF